MSEQTAELMPKQETRPVAAARFDEIIAAAKAQIDASKGCVVTDPTDVRGMKQSRDFRLALRQIRIAGEKLHKEAKEEFLRAGRAIDGMKNILLAAIEPEEKRLNDQEKIAERLQAERDAALRLKRQNEIRDLTGMDPVTFGTVESMPDAEWARFFGQLKAGVDARKEAERKAREEAEAKANAEREEQGRIRAENAKLKAEADAREAAMRAEREAAAAKAAEEAKERARLAAELKAKQDAENAKIEAERAAAAKAAQAPDADKLAALAFAVAEIALPEMATPAGAQALACIVQAKETFVAAIKHELFYLGK